MNKNSKEILSKVDVRYERPKWIVAMASIGCLVYSISFIILCIGISYAKMIYSKIEETSLELTVYEKIVLSLFVLAILLIVIESIIMYFSYICDNYDSHINKIETENSKKIVETTQHYETILDGYKKELAQMGEMNSSLSALLKSKRPFSLLASMVADFETSIFEKEEHYLRYKVHPARAAADKVNEIKNIMYQNVEVCKQMTYKYELLLTTFPELKSYVDDEEALIHLTDYSTMTDFNDNHDRVRDWVSKEDYISMSVDERNQLALDRYKKRAKSNWELGIEYELYIGHLLREGKYPFTGKFQVNQFGEFNGLEDLGRDIIAERVGVNGVRSIYIIQCKRWSETKVIHENSICQLFGTTIEYKIRHSNFFNCEFVPVFISTTDLSDMAKKFAKHLGVVVYIIPMGDYPMIKCNINGGERIYHLPFDQQYHRTVIKNDGEFYAMTVKEATNKGFRRAMKHFLN